jgi:hypothetical protein
VLRRDNWSSGRVAPPVGLQGGLIGRHRRGSVMKSVFQASGDTGKDVSDIDHALHALAIFVEGAAGNCRDPACARDLPACIDVVGVDRAGSADRCPALRFARSLRVEVVPARVASGQPCARKSALATQVFEAICAADDHV